MRNDDDTPSEDTDASVDGVRVEPVASSEVRGPEQPNRASPATAPDGTTRLSPRGKVARALIATLAVIVALAVLLLRTNVALPPVVARLLTPAPTPTPPPGHFMSGHWEQVHGPPVPPGDPFTLAPAPADPLMAYTCTFPAPTDATGAVVSRAITVWQTHDAGQTWRQVALPVILGTTCAVTTARDGSPRVTLNVDNYALDQNAQACAHSQHFLSDDDGATWRRIEHASIAPPVSDGGDCRMWATARRLFMETSVSNNGRQGPSTLERSDDSELTWVRADHGLAEVQANWYAQPLDGSGNTLGALVGDAPDLWITHDAGASWRRMGSIPRDRLGTGAVSDLITEARLGGGPKACQCVFALAYSSYAANLPWQHIYTSHDYVHWTTLPPIPVTGTSATRSGVYDILGTTADGKLLALGAEPSVGVVATPDKRGHVASPPPRLWAWDTHVGRWEVAETPVPCQDLQTCFLYTNGVSVVTGPDGAARGTTLWVTAPTTETFYRLFIPTV
jgi:hypothetical protein